MTMYDILIQLTWNIVCNVRSYPRTSKPWIRRILCSTRRGTRTLL